VATDYQERAFGVGSMSKQASSDRADRIQRWESRTCNDCRALNAQWHEEASDDASHPNDGSTTAATRIGTALHMGARRSRHPWVIALAGFRVGGMAGIQAAGWIRLPR
jgi:hypothetical protein